MAQFVNSLAVASRNEHVVFLRLAVDDGSFNLDSAGLPIRGTTVATVAIQADVFDGFVNAQQQQEVS